MIALALKIVMVLVTMFGLAVLISAGAIHRMRCRLCGKRATVFVTGNFVPSCDDCQEEIMRMVRR